MSGHEGAQVSGRRIALIFPFIVIGVVWLYFFAGAYGGVYLAAVRVSSVVIAATVLLGWLAISWKRPALRPRSRLTPMLVIAVATLAATTLTSRNPRISLDFVGYAVLLAGLYLLLVTILRSPVLRPRMGVLMVGLTIAVCGWYLWAVVGDWVIWWQMVGHLAVPPLRPAFEGLTFGNPGLVAAMAVLTALAAAGHLGGAGRAGWIAAGVLGLFVVAVVILSGTRGAWVAVAATVAAAVVLAIAGSSGRARAAALLRTGRGQLALVVGLLVVIVAAAFLGPTMLERVLNSGDGGRTAYWAAALRMFQASPITGVGPGMWAPERIASTVFPDIDFYIAHAHNLYLETASELGLVGLAAGAAVVALAARLVLGGLRGGDPERRRWAVVALLGTLYVAVHQMFDLYVGMPAALFVFAVPFAWLDATDPATEPVAVAARWPVRLRASAPMAFALAVVLTVAWTMWNERPALTFADAVTAADAGDWATAADDARVAAAADSSMAPYRLVAGLSAAHRAQDGSTDMAAAAALDGLPNAWLNLAALQLEAGDGSAARTSLGAAMRLGSQQPALLVAAGNIDEVLGDTTAADREYVAAITTLPRMAGADYWRSPARADRWPAIAQAVAEALDPVAQVDFWVSAGDLANARAAAAAIPDGAARGVAELAIAAWAGDAGAEAKLQDMARQQPKDTTVAGWCARLAAHRGDGGAAAAYRAWLEIVSPYSSSLGLEIRITDQLTVAASTAGADSGTYGIYTYRRPTPADLLIPGLPHLEWYVGLPATSG